VQTDEMAEENNQDAPVEQVERIASLRVRIIASTSIAGCTGPHL
jgi:hypothetical protein